TMVRKRVVLPAPFRPTSPTLSPAWTVNEASSTTTRPATSIVSSWVLSTAHDRTGQGRNRLLHIPRRPGGVPLLTDGAVGAGQTNDGVSLDDRCRLRLDPRMKEPQVEPAASGTLARV